MATSSETKSAKKRFAALRKEYSEADNNKAIEKLVTARIGLLLRHPFFGNMATRLKLEEASTWCSTIATDGRKFYYNVGFVLQCKPKVAEFGFAHEVLHNVFDHMGRRGTRNPRISNIAADYAVNQICKDERIGEFPDFMQIYQDNKYRGWAYEAIYDEVLKNQTEEDDDDFLFDEHIEFDDLTPEEQKTIRDEIKEAMIAAAQSASNDKLPEAIRRMISDFTEPKMDWRELLRMNIQSIIRSNYSFSRPNRKSQHSGAILPGMTTDQAVDVSIAVDMSGSISHKQATDFLSEVKGIMDEYEDFRLDLWCFDTGVYNHEVFTQDNADEIMDYRVKGGGGTDFDVNFEFMKNNDIEPKKFIMFTDGYPCGSWGDSDYCDTLFVIHGNETIKAPFGQTAYYK